MAYIGKSIESGTFSVLDTSGNTYNGSNTTFNLGTQVGSTAQLLVSHDGVIQKPGTDYTLASGGTQITFSTAPASGASIFIVEISGAVGGPLDADLNGTELILDTDGDTSITADTDDQIDIKIAGADDFKFSANAMNVLSGSTLTIDSGATITNSGTANGFGTDPDGAQVFNESGAAVDFRVESDNNTEALTMDGANGIWGIGTQYGTYALKIDGVGNSGLFTGGVVSCGSLDNRSDARLKENITPLGDSLNILNQLQPVTFNLTKDVFAGEDFAGFIAQEVKTVFPVAVRGNENETEDVLNEDGEVTQRPVYMSIKMMEMIALLTKSIQELSAKVTALENK